MENCIHDWRDKLVDGTAAIYSVHLARTGEHIGTAAIGVDDHPQISGHMNGRLSPQHQREATVLLMREETRLWGPDSACAAIQAAPVSH